MLTRNVLLADVDNPRLGGHGLLANTKQHELS